MLDLWIALLPASNPHDAPASTSAQPPPQDASTSSLSRPRRPGSLALRRPAAPRRLERPMLDLWIALLPASNLRCARFDLRHYVPPSTASVSGPFRSWDIHGLGFVGRTQVVSKTSSMSAQGCSGSGVGVGGWWAAFFLLSRTLRRMHAGSLQTWGSVDGAFSFFLFFFFFFFFFFFSFPFRTFPSSIPSAAPPRSDGCKFNFVSYCYCITAVLLPVTTVPLLLLVLLRLHRGLPITARLCYCTA